MDRFPIEIKSDNQIWKNDRILSRENLEKISVSAGTASITVQDYNSVDATVPKVVMSGTAPQETTNAWELLTHGWRAELQFCEGEGQDNPFESMTIYTASVGAVAIQGGTEYEVHDESNTLQIRTLKQTAGIRDDGVFTLSDFVEIYHFYFDDPDKTISDGTVTVRLYSVAEASLVETKTIKVNTDYESIRFNNLKMNHDYRIEFMAQHYNVYYESSKGETNYTFPEMIKFSTGEGITGSLDMKDITPSKESGKDWIASVTMILGDRKNELKNGKYSLVLKGAEGMDVENFKLKEIERIETDFPYAEAAGGEISRVQSFDCQGFWTYEVDLVISVRGYENIVLDRVNFTTETGMDTISNWRELYDKLYKNPTGKFVVVADIERTDYKAGNSLNFSGTVDFQGHTLSFPEGNDYNSCVISQLTSTGVIENLVFDYHRSPATRLNQSAGLVGRNYGTIRNVVMKVSLDTIQANQSSGFLTYTNENSGVIENFSVKIEKELHARSGMGMITSSNRGTIRRGVVYGKNMVLESCVYGGNIYTDSGYSGAIAYANNETGLIEDVFVLNNLAVEYNVREVKDSKTGKIDLVPNYPFVQTGGIVSSTRGTVRNSFFVGDLYYFTYEDNKQSPYQILNLGGTTVGSRSKDGRCTDLYHVSLQDASYPSDLGEKTQVQRLWDAVWYEKVFQSPDAFEIESQLASGYYPKVKMSDSMSGKQENIALPAAPGADTPEYVSSKVVSQTNKEAELLLYFRSNNLQKITQVGINGLTTEVLDQGVESGMYVVRLRVSDPLTFNSKYLYATLTYEINAATHETKTVQCGQIRSLWRLISIMRSPHMKTGFP